MYLFRVHVENGVYISRYFNFILVYVCRCHVQQFVRYKTDIHATKTILARSCSFEN